MLSWLQKPKLMHLLQWRNFYWIIIISLSHWVWIAKVEGFLFMLNHQFNNRAGKFRQKYSSTIVSNVFLVNLWWTELKSELKSCQFLNVLQLKNNKKNNLRAWKLNKDLSQIECFQCCLSIENSNSVFYFLLWK